MHPCPDCGGPAACQPVYKHRWWWCAACRCAWRERRGRLPTDLLPIGLRERLPEVLSWDTALNTDPGAAFFRADYSAGAAGTPYADEAARLRALLDRLGVDATGAVLDVGGGPGFALAGLGARRAVLTDLAEHAVAHARGALGLEATRYDFDGPPLDAVAQGHFDLVMVRYAVNWALRLESLVESLINLTGPGAACLITFVLPTRGAILTSALEDAAPRRLWTAAAVEDAFTARGWAVAARFEPDPPMWYWTPRGPHAAIFGLPWALGPGPAGRDLRQLHAGLLLRRQSAAE